MPQQTSPNSTPAGMPGINPAHAGKYSAPHFPTMAAFTKAITPGQVGYSADLWSAKQRMTIATEPIVGERVWNGTHARTYVLGTTVLVLAADTNVVLETTGAPASSTGTSGDYAVDAAAGVYYGPKTTVWPSAVSFASLPAVINGGNGLVP